MRTATPALARVVRFCIVRTWPGRDPRRFCSARSWQRRCKMALVQAVDPRVSFAELQQWPEDGRRYELYDGEVIVAPAPYPRHQRVAQHVGELLREYELARGGLAFSVPIDIVFTKFDVLQPDVVFFLPERCSLVNMMQAAEVRPDLAVEVLSRSTEARDRGRKMQQLARFGVPGTGSWIPCGTRWRSTRGQAITATFPSRSTPTATPLRRTCSPN